MSEYDIERLLAEYHDAREEYAFYRDELLGMVESEDQGTEMWAEYRSSLKSLGQKRMDLHKKLRAAGITPSSDGVHRSVQPDTDRSGDLNE